MTSRRTGFPSLAARIGVVVAFAAWTLPAQVTGSMDDELLTAAPWRPAGMTPEIERAIERGTAWLVAAQGRDGSWRSGGETGSFPVAMTALAGTALLAGGSTPTRGPYYREVRRATTFLLRSVEPDGLITSAFEDARSMYGHGFATLFLAQVYGMEEDRERRAEIRRALEGAVELIARSQSVAGGWLYQPTSNGDEGSVTVTQMQALRACRNVGITVPRETVERAVDYVRRSANRDGSIRYSISSAGGGRPAITAAAVAVLYNAGRYDDPLAEKALQYAQRTLSVSQGDAHYFYAHYYLAQALYQRGGDEWTSYYERIAGRLLQLQNKESGAWQGDNVGEVYGTALSLTILQLPLAQVPIYLR
jgi:hypothetical protein